MQYFIHLIFVLIHFFYWLIWVQIVKINWDNYYAFFCWRPWRQQWSTSYLGSTIRHTCICTYRRPEDVFQDLRLNWRLISTWRSGDTREGSVHSGRCRVFIEGENRCHMSAIYKRKGEQTRWGNNERPEDLSSPAHTHTHTPSFISLELTSF